MDAEFQAAVYATVRRIPRGRVSTYGDVAAAAGWPGYARHVGKALSLLAEGSKVPWHRVVNAAGGISPRGDGTSVAEQRARLLREGVPFRPDGRVLLRACRF
ncbi:MAG: MGMT family protein [Candidatus Xenobia bacterium]